jgi:hypothetical protein
MCVVLAGVPAPARNHAGAQIKLMLAAVKNRDAVLLVPQFNFFRDSPGAGPMNKCFLDLIDATVVFGNAGGAAARNSVVMVLQLAADATKTSPVQAFCQGRNEAAAGSALDTLAILADMAIRTNEPREVVRVLFDVMANTESANVLPPRFAATLK